MISPDTEYAPAAVRDRFLDALDRGDPDLCSQLATNLTGCKNPLPGMTCDLLGLPVGSTYGSAARRLLVRAPLISPKASVDALPDRSHG